MTWKLPEKQSPPLGKKLLLLSWGGGISLGRWDIDNPDVAWMELPEPSLEIKEKISKRWMTK